jgi:transcriptional regulator of acetoin/glycerol metabolism
VAIARGAELLPDDLPEEVAATPEPAPPRESTVAAARERADRETIVATLARHAGEIGAAARELQISRTTMWRLMKKYGIPSP